MDEESTAGEVKELLEHLLGLGDMTPYGSKFFGDTIEMIVDEIDKGPDTYHKDDLETAFEQAVSMAAHTPAHSPPQGFVCLSGVCRAEAPTTTAPAPAAGDSRGGRGPRGGRQRAGGDGGSGEGGMDVEWEGAPPSDPSSSGASASTEEEEAAHTRKRRRRNLKPCRYDKSINEPRERDGDSNESEGEDDLAWANGESRKGVGRKRCNITV
ncbi:unnamed protein product [Vitrella brassicaformis CCMP3155]|uniref:Uncharacterized protein n=1 Tax=Vitrella brassicaformis (strain CCMP3155) TaxID=1169540 RepID=A0A0G4F819_VITBC|nr:unnamed protein product [Vitrella brassicaformis CCMP3155]|eukprot:CEM08858.1 unnamed protein product [Vitrella brassicaformis CCMP3155]